MSDAKVIIRDDDGNVKRVKPLPEREVRAMDSRIERVLEDVQRGRAEKHAARNVDARDILEHEADVLKNRHLDENGYWKKVMEYYGFTWLEPQQLDEQVGLMKVIPSKLTENDPNVRDRFGRPIQNTHLYWTRNHQFGQWRDVVGARRRPHPALRGMAFMMKDLVDLFGEPKDFDRWAKERIRIYRAKRLGFRTPRR